MITLRGKDLRLPGPSVLAVGKFECIHLGHRALIDEVVRLAQRGTALGSSALISAMIVFEPHPYRVLVDPKYKPLFTGPEREFLARRLDIDYLLEYPFDREFAAMPPADFCRLLFEDLQGRIIVVGEGYRFGHKREGTIDTLRQIARKYGAQVHVVAPRKGDMNTRINDIMPFSDLGAGEHISHLHNMSKISTSTIHGLLSQNKLTEAESLLGYPFFISGTVAPGRQLGRTIGFPTANLYPQEDKFLLTDGVYATRTILDGNRYKSITNIGVRPTIETTDAPRSVETHLLGYTGVELYGKHIYVEFLSFIRPERRFESLEALKAQILADCKTSYFLHSK